VPRRQINFNVSKIRFYRRRYGALFGEGLRLFLLLTFVYQLALEAVKWLLGHKRPLRRQRIVAHLTVLRSGLRPRQLGELPVGSVDAASTSSAVAVSSPTGSSPPAHAAPRVLFITGEYPPTIGGIGDYTARLAASLRGAGIQVGILTAGGTPVPGEVGVARSIPGWGLRGLPAIARAIRAARPDLIHIQYQAGAFAGRGGIILLARWLRLRRRIPVVVTFHDRCVPYLFPKAGLVRAVALNDLARSAVATIATNGDDWATFNADKSIAQHLHLIPIGSNIVALEPAQSGDGRSATRAALGVAPQTTVIAYFGLISASKGLDLLLDAVARAADQLADFRLLLIGGTASATDREAFGESGDLAGALRARGLEQLTTITGALPAAAVAAHLAAADVVILPYRDGASWRRGSLLAALAAGVPTITTVPQRGYDAGGRLPSLDDGLHAALVPANDPAALAAALVRLASDPAARARLATGGRAVAQHFSWATIAAAHRELYETIATADRARRGWFA
jgi:glycosyltransferase involved in cell wall biosynthesis